MPGQIEAENFDKGGQGVAYHDADASNNGGQYRAQEGVDIEHTSNTTGGYNVGWMLASEWLEYTVNVDASGVYTIEARVASAGVGGKFHIEFDGVDKTGSLMVPNTGGWQRWQTIRKTGVQLNAGQQVMRVALDSNGATGWVGNVNYIRIIASPSH